MPTLPFVLAAALLAAPDPAPRLSPAFPPEEEAFRALAAAGAGEPGISDVQRAAAREADRAFAGADGARRRTRIAALLPRLTAELRLDQSSSRVVGLQGSGEVDYLRLEPGTAIHVRATWDLRDLAGARADGDGVSVAAAKSRAREAAVQRATALFYARRRAFLALLLAPPAAPLARAEAELEVDRLGAELDAITGGLFSRGGRP